MKYVEFGYREDLLKGPISSFLDHLRWISAWLVVIAHSRNLLFPDFSSISQTANPAVKLFYFFTLFGTQSVVIFFVVSGLLVGGKVAKGVINRQFQIRSYLTDRFVRLYVVLIPAILLSFALNHFSPSPCHYSPAETAGNLLFVQNLLTQPLCNNHPLWSLSNEAFYYLAAGLLGVSLCSQRNRPLLICGTLLIAFIALIFHDGTARSVAFGATLWLLGLTPWFIRVRINFLYSIPLLLTILTLSRSHFFQDEFIGNSLIAAVLAFTLSCDFRNRIPSGESLAKFSYSLYLIHMPIGIYIASHTGILSPFRATSYMAFSISSLLILFSAYIFWILFESRTNFVKKIFTRN